MPIREVVTRGFAGQGDGIKFVTTAGYLSAGPPPPVPFPLPAFYLKAPLWHWLVARRSPPVIAYPYPLSTMSVEPMGIEFSQRCPPGQTVASAQAWLIDPAGNSTPVSSGDISYPTSTKVAVVVGSFTLPPGYSVPAPYRLNVLALTTGGAELPFAITFNVEYNDAASGVPGG